MSTNGGTPPLFARIDRLEEGYDELKVTARENSDSIDEMKDKLSEVSERTASMEGKLDVLLEMHRERRKQVSVLEFNGPLGIKLNARNLATPLLFFLILAALIAFLLRH